MVIRRDLERLTESGFPRSFPVVQLPNIPLMVGLVAGAIGRLVHGTKHDYAVSLSYLAIGVWAYGELAHGVNWFRRLLGATFAILMVVRVAKALHG
ncbi:MAG TPA: hypothetical protein VFY36_00620 [Solirubrobacteraceae bacterium]|nr:hypothetical protein [Solirubrobacteraceae bacterium]